MTPAHYKQDYLTSNFRRSEFACKGKDCCSNSAPVDIQLPIRLERFRTLSGNRKTKVLSGFRCLKHNRSEEVGSEDTSQHPLGKAADIEKYEDLTIDEMSKNAELAGFDGIILYDTFIHVDVRGKRYRDDRRTKEL